MAKYERPKPEYVVLDTDLALFKNMLIRDMEEMISNFDIVKVNYGKYINLYGSLENGMNFSTNSNVEVEGDLSPIQDNVVRLYSFMISSQMVNTLADQNYTKIIKLFNTDRSQYEIACKSIVRYLYTSLKLYCHITNFKNEVYKTIENKIKNILSILIYN